MNNQDNQSNSEIIKATREFRDAMTVETAFIDIAKMLSRSADRLDVTTAALRESTKKHVASVAAVRVWESTMMEACGEDGPASVAIKFKELLKERDALERELCMSEAKCKGYFSDAAVASLKCDALAAEGEQMLRLLSDISDNHVEYYSEGEDGMFAGVPLDYVSEINMYVSRDVNAENPFTATDAALAEIRDEALAQYANKSGFSFQHGSIHAHFGHGDLMVGSVTFEDGSAGINFAPVREKLGGAGTNYEWTKGKNTQEVESVFVISSTNVEGLEVIKGKLDEAIAELRKESGKCSN